MVLGSEGRLGELVPGGVEWEGVKEVVFEGVDGLPEGREWVEAFPGLERVVVKGGRVKGFEGMPVELVGIFGNVHVRGLRVEIERFGGDEREEEANLDQRGTYRYPGR